MRGVKQKPFMLMEQTPSQQNWQPYNALKRPGQMRAQSYQTIAHGADTIQFFQLRRSVGGCEKFHGAVIGHAGTENTRVFREVSVLGHELEKLNGLLGAENQSKVGIVFDWDNYWALEYTSGPHKDLTYVDQIHAYYRYFYERNISVDMIPVDADFSRYSAVIAPMLYMVKESMQSELEAYVQAGGILVTGFMSGIVNESDNVHLGGYPGPLRQLAGIWAEEIDALMPEQTNVLCFTDGTKGTCSMLCDIIHLEGAVSVADYGSDFYAGSPAITRNSFGKGTVFYVGTQPDETALAKTLDQVVTAAKIIPTVNEPTKLEVTRRVNEDTAYFFLMNFSGESCPVPRSFAGATDMLSGQPLTADTVLQPYDVALVSQRV
jgi:beta-galactosidase